MRNGIDVRDDAPLELPLAHVLIGRGAAGTSPTGDRGSFRGRGSCWGRRVFDPRSTFSQTRGCRSPKPVIARSLRVRCTAAPEGDVGLTYPHRLWLVGVVDEVERFLGFALLCQYGGKSKAPHVSDRGIAALPLEP